MWSDPYLLVIAQVSPPSTPADTCTLEPHLSMKCGMHMHVQKMASNKSLVLSKVTEILLVKDHARKGKQPFYVKTIEITCATLAVGQFN